MERLLVEIVCSVFLRHFTKPDNLRTKILILRRIITKSDILRNSGDNKNKEVSTSTRIMLDAVATATAKYSFCVILWCGVSSDLVGLLLNSHLSSFFFYSTIQQLTCQSNIVRTAATVLYKLCRLSYRQVCHNLHFYSCYSFCASAYPRTRIA